MFFFFPTDPQIDTQHALFRRGKKKKKKKLAYDTSYCSPQSLLYHPNIFATPVSPILAILAVCVTHLKRLSQVCTVMCS